MSPRSGTEQIGIDLEHNPPRWAFVLSFVVYVALGYQFKTIVLNWIIGPAWMILTLFVLPASIGWLGGFVRSRSGHRATP